MIDKIAGYLSQSNKAVAFTGAGISTESGIPDFRSPGGVWSRYQPVLFQDFLTNGDARRQYWQMKKEAYRELKGAKPNAGHRALAALEAAGKLAAVITHGTSRYCICLKCDARYDPDLVQERLESGVEVPLCDKCGGLLKSATISFGQQLPQDVLSEALDLCLQTDLILAIGSSLVVEPAASLPLQAKQNGGRLVIINKTETPLDDLADVIVREPIGETLTQVVNRLGISDCGFRIAD